MTGLDEALKQAASEEAAERDLPGKYVIPLLNTSGQPALASLQNRVSGNGFMKRLCPVAAGEGILTTGTFSQKF